MRYFLIILLCVLSHLSVSAQNIAIKTNALYDAAQTINLGLEVSLGRRTTLDISGNYNAWYTDKSVNAKMRHFMIQPEFRYFFCESMRGHFIGAHAHILEYNVSGDHWLPQLFKSASNLSGVSDGVSRYQGDGYGAGIVYGYDWIISPHFNIEFAVGAGYIYFDYDRYGPSKCDTYIESSTKDYWGLTKLAVSLVYIIK